MRDQKVSKINKLNFDNNVEKHNIQFEYGFTQLNNFLYILCWKYPHTVPRLIIDVNNGWPFVFIFAIELQFHLWLRNWCWHSFTAWWNPRNAASTWSGNLLHNFCWCFVKRLILQKANAFNFRLPWADCPRSFIMLLWFANVSRYSKWFSFSLISSLVIARYIQWTVRTAIAFIHKN